MDEFKATLGANHAKEKNLLVDKLYYQTDSIASRVQWNVAKIKNGIRKQARKILSMKIQN